GSSTSRTRRLDQQAEADRTRRRLWWVMGSVGVGVVVLLIVVLVWAFRGKPEPPTTPKEGRTLYVGPEAEFHTVADAVKRVGPGDRIVVQKPQVRERLLLGGSQRERQQLRGVRLEADPQGPPIEWKPPGGQKPGDGSLLSLAGIEGFHVK